MATKRFVAKNGVDNNSQTVTNVADPVNAQDAATRAYVLANAGTAPLATNIAGQTTNGVLYQSGSGITASTAASTSVGQMLATVTSGGAPTFITPTLMNLPGAWTKKAVDCATTVNISLIGTQTIDVSFSAVAGSRVLVKNQTTASQNGIYVVPVGAGVGTGDWTRDIDCDINSEVAGATTSVDSGGQAGQLWTTNFLPADTLGTTAMNWYRVLDTSSVIPVDNGGTGVATAPTAGGIGWGASTSAQGYSAAGTAGQLLLSGGAGVPTWSTLSGAAGRLTSTLTGTTTSATGQIYLNGATNNRIDYAVAGTGIPTLTNISAGTKIVLSPAISASLVDYAIGVDTAAGGGVWNSVPSTSFNFKWYAGATQVASIASAAGVGKFFTIQPVPGATAGTGASAALLTIAHMLASIVATPTGAATYTLPTGTLMDATIGTYVAINMGFEWSITNVAAFVITIAAGATHTLPVAFGTIAAGSTTAPTTARFRTIKTAANTYITYRI